MTGHVPTILVVDDEETIRDSLQMFLEAQGWDVAAAESAEQALALLADRAFDAAVVDIRLPGQSGDAMIAEAHVRSPGTRWIIFTGSMEFRLGPELADLGMTPEDVFAKPLGDMGQLVDRLRHLLARSAR